MIESKTADELIIDNAPEGATHYCCGTYCKANKDFFYDWDGEYWCAYFVPDGYMRSLADIEAIVEKGKKIAELEQAIMSNCYDDVSTSSKRLMSLVTPLNKIGVTKNMNMKKMAKNKGYKFASLLAMTLYENYYMKKPDAVAFELLDTTAGVVSQIDNMLTGVIDEKAEAIRLLKVENETLIAKLRDDNEALKAKDKSIAELEKENLKALGWIAKAMMQGLSKVDCSDELLKIIAIRDLEQQAKGIEEVIKEMRVPPESLSFGINDIEELRQYFLNKAKQLKGDPK